MKQSILLGLIGLCALVPAHAGYVTHYTISMQSGANAVDGIIKFETFGAGFGASWPDWIDGDGAVSTLNQVFATPGPRTSAFFMGTSYDGETFGTQHTAAELAALTGKHVVLFLDNTAATAMVSGGLDFNVLFPGFDEATVIGWLEVVGQIGTPPTDETEFNNDLDHLSDFATYARDTYSAFFALSPDQFSPPGAFSVLQFSTATTVGSGSVAQESLPAETPEPGTFGSMLGLGLTAFGIGLRRRRRNS